MAVFLSGGDTPPRQASLFETWIRQPSAISRSHRIGRRGERSDLGTPFGSPIQERELSVQAKFALIKLVAGEKPEPYQS